MGHKNKKSSKKISRANTTEYSREFKQFCLHWQQLQQCLQGYRDSSIKSLYSDNDSAMSEIDTITASAFDKVLEKFSNTTMVEDFQVVINAFNQLCGNTGNRDSDAVIRDGISKACQEIMANQQVRGELFLQWFNIIRYLSTILTHLEATITYSGLTEKFTMMSTYVNDINRGVEILFSRGQSLSAVIKKSLAELGTTSHQVLIYCYIATGKAADAYPFLLKKQYYRKKLTELELLKKAEICADSQLMLMMSDDEKKWINLLKKRDSFTRLGELHVAAGNVAGAAECLTIIMGILDQFLTQKECNFIPVSVIDLATKISSYYDNKKDYAKSIKYFRYTKKLCQQVLSADEIRAYTNAAYMDLDTSLEADLPDIKTKNASASEKIMSLTKQYGDFLITLFEEQDFQIIINLFDLKLTFSNEIKAQQFKEFFSQYVTMTLDKTKTNLIVKRFIDIHESKFKNGLDAFKNATKSQAEKSSSASISQDASALEYYIPLSLKPSREPRRIRKGKQEVVSEHSVEDEVIDNNDTHVAECITDTSGRMLYHLLNDFTGTQYVTVDWSKAEASELGSRITPTIKQKFESHFEQPRIVGKYGSGFKWAKGIWAKQQGIALKLKVGEDIELAAARRVDVTEAGEVRHVYEFDRAINHKSMRK